MFKKHQDGSKKGQPFPYVLFLQNHGVYFGTKPESNVDNSEIHHQNIGLSPLPVTVANEGL